MLTAEQKADYIIEPYRCPFCRSFNIQQSQHDFKGNTVVASVWCHDCRKEWTDTYRLESVEEEN